MRALAKPVYERYRSSKKGQEILLQGWRARHDGRWLSLQGMDGVLGDDLNAGPARHYMQERVRHGYRPY